MFVLTENGAPIRKAHDAAKAWGSDAVTGHPTDSAGICVFSDGRTLEVRELSPGADVWRVTHPSGMHYFYGTAKAMRFEYAGFLSADRLEWDGWAEVYA